MPAGELIRSGAAAGPGGSGQTIIYQKVQPLATAQDGDLVSNDAFSSKPASIIGLLVNRVKLEKVCVDRETVQYPPADLGTAFDSFVGKILTDGTKILVLGSFATYQGAAAPRLVRLYDTGSIETIIGSLFNNSIDQMIVDSDGKYLCCGGGFSTYDSVTVNRLVRLNKDRSIDYTFDIGFSGTFKGLNAEVRGVIEDSSGKYVLVGDFTNYKGETGINRIMRLNKDGSKDATFNPGTGFAQYNAGKIIEDLGIDKYVVAGNFTTYNDYAINRIVRINKDGSRDETFNPGTGFNKGINCIVQQGEKYYCGGSFTTYNNISKNYIVRLNRDGSIDNTFNMGTGFTSTVYGFPYVSSILPLPDGRVLVGGNFNRYNGQPVQSLVMLNSDGSIDSSFSVLVEDAQAVNTIDRYDGKFLIGGGFRTVNGETRNRFAVLDENGSLDTGKTKIEFNPDPAILLKNGQPVTLPEFDETTRIGWHGTKSGYQIESTDEIQIVYVEQQ